LNADLMGYMCELVFLYNMCKNNDQLECGERQSFHMQVSKKIYWAHNAQI
jgi:hypothetical protein